MCDLIKRYIVKVSCGVKIYLIMVMGNREEDRSCVYLEKTLNLKMIGATPQWDVKINTKIDREFHNEIILVM